MKCKTRENSWPTKFNDFFVRLLKNKERLTAVDIIARRQFGNEKQQQQQQQQQLPPFEFKAPAPADLYVDGSMPAMPIEKTPSVASLHESICTELGSSSGSILIKAGGGDATTMAAAATIAASTPTSIARSPSNSSSSSGSGSGGISIGRRQQQQREQQYCGCGSVAEVISPDSVDSSSGSGHNAAVQLGCGYMHAGNYSSPLAIAVAAEERERRDSSSRYYGTPKSSASSYNTNSSSINSGGSGSTMLRNNISNISSNMNNSRQLDVAVVGAVGGGARSRLDEGGSGGSSGSGKDALKKYPDDFYFKRFLGEGSFSTVFLGICRYTKNKYAIKACSKNILVREKKKEHAIRERQALKMLSNAPGFVHLYFTFQDFERLFFVITLAPNGDLLPHILRNHGFHIDLARHYAAELVLACEEMHSRNIVHRDLKPENILLDEDMHTLVTDFGSVKLLTDEEALEAREQLKALYYDNSDYDNAGDCNGGSDETYKQSSSLTGSRQQQQSDDDVDDVDDADKRPARAVDCHQGGGSSASSSSSPTATPLAGAYRGRINSFVGTAQYVSPEVVRIGPISHATDLWALGCIIYQMVAGLPPFRGANEFLIFKEMLDLKLSFPEGFDKSAEDLVRKLLVLNPGRRLGAQDELGYYKSIREHAFFEGIDWANVRKEPPPPMAFMRKAPAAKSGDDDYDEDLNVAGIEPGIDSRQMQRLLGAELGCDIGSSAAPVKHQRSGNHLAARRGNAKGAISFDLTVEEKQKRLEEQKSDKWHVFAEDEVILKKGFLLKRKGLFARKRMFLLTTGPKLIYIEPVQMIKKGEIPFGPELRAEAKNFQQFFVHTMDRTYYLEDPESYALKWIADIEKLHKVVYPEQQQTLKQTADGGGSATSSSGATGATPKQFKPNSPTSKTKATASSASASATGTKTSPKTSPTSLKKKLFGGGGSSRKGGSSTSITSTTQTRTNSSSSKTSERERTTSE